MKLRVCLGSLLLALCIAETPRASSTPQAAPLACGPFGDPLAGIKASAGAKPKRAGGIVAGPFTDNTNIQHFACLYEPPAASSGNPLPLIVFLHGTAQNADTAAQATNLLQFLKTANVTDDQSRPGFILLAPGSRKLKSAVPLGTIGGVNLSAFNGATVWDTFYRQYSPAGDVSLAGVNYPENSDGAAIDHFISQEVSSGKVDTNRIYVWGWSSGGAMAYLYGLNRSTIAAAAAYAGPNPFQFVAEFDPCPQFPVDRPATDKWEIQIANPRLHTWQVKNSCDWLTICKNEEILIHELLPLGATAEDFFIDDKQNQAADCDLLCDDGLSNDATSFNGRGFKNHIRWPSKWTGQALDFFRRNPLAP